MGRRVKAWCLLIRADASLSLSLSLSLVLKPVLKAPAFYQRLKLSCDEQLAHLQHTLFSNSTCAAT